MKQPLFCGYIRGGRRYRPFNTAAKEKEKDHLLPAVMFCQYYTRKTVHGKEDRFAIAGTNLSYFV